MKRNSDIQKRFPCYYNQLILRECLKQMKPRPSMRLVADRLGMNNHTVRRVFKGTASQKQVWPVAEFFKIDWKTLHDLDLPLDEFDRAVLTKAVRSSGPVSVGGRGPARLKRRGTYTGVRH